MANYLDFLVALDDHLRASVTGEVTFVNDLHGIARAAGLFSPPQSQAAAWTGQLIDRGYVAHSRPPISGRPAPPLGVGWSEDDLARFGRFELTEAGLAAAERERQARRAQATDLTLSPVGLLSAAWLTDDWREGVKMQLAGLRGALDREDWTLAVGAAKNLVEAAAHVVLKRAGQEPPGRPSVSTLVRAACGVSGAPDDLARRLAAVVQAIADLRNASDAGHGQAERTEVPATDARLAASGAVAVVAFLLADG